MTTNLHVCPKCRNQMEEGFTLDHTHGGQVQSHWVEGEVEKSFWTGVKTGGKRQIPISTFRCTNCGYLELYARQSPATS